MSNVDRQAQRANVPVWFEIPAAELPRAVEFYETVLGVELTSQHIGGQDLAIFPRRAEAGTTGAVVAAPNQKPSGNGVVVYLNADPQLAQVLARVPKAGGEVLLPRTALPDGMGYFAQIRDTEGNRVGLHAMA
jgi:predicted enzyme related to lactoylglutathione lyase